MQVLAATQMPEEPAGWFQGTADSIRKFIWVLEVVDIFSFMDDHSLILVALSLCNFGFSCTYLGLLQSQIY